MKTYKIHFIRHGMTDANIDGRYIGCKTDLPLSPEGLRELRGLRENLEYPEIEVLYTSPMLRCKQTAAALYSGFDPISVDELTEYDFGVFENKTAAELEIMPEYLEWTSGKISATPDGEDTNNFIKRIALGINMIVRDMMEKDITNAGVIMHGGAIMMFLATCAVPRKRSVEWTSDNGRGYSIMITPSLYHSSGIVEVYDII